jgi:hypothetical protein
MYLQRLTTKLREQGHHAVGIRPAPLRVWVGSGQAMGDPTGKAIRIHLRQLSNRAAAGMILKAALAGGRSWTSLRARRIATWGLGLVWLAHRTHRRDRWGALVKGFPREFWAALLRDPNDTRRAPYTRKSCPGNERDEKYRDQHSCTMCRAPGIPATSSLFGVHRFGAAPHSGDVGYLAPLREVGLVYSQQLPAKEVEAWEVGPKGHALNRYWVVTDCPGSIPDDDTRAAAWGFVELARLDVLELVRQLKRAAGPPAPPD